jgi:electron transfer flavoprotein beta subunit
MMNIFVLLSGVADPKWPLVTLTIDPQTTREKNRLALSPFDEAALETALKIRELRPETELTVLLFGGAESDALLRKVIAYKPHRALRMELPQAAPWDVGSFARQIKAALGEIDVSADLLLIGREFGDYDNGLVPAFLARELGLPFFGLAQHVTWDGDVLRFLREAGSVEEVLPVDAAFIVSVTNDRRNRLRHPLMKNVIEAKRAPINVATAPPPVAPSVQQTMIGESPPRTRTADCKLLTGATRVEELAEYLANWRLVR